MSLRGSTHRQGQARGLIAFAALLCALLVLPQAARAAAGPIEGTVTDAMTHEPLSDVFVEAIWRGAGEPPTGSGFPFAYTEPDGTFAISGLGEGEWSIAFSTPTGGYLTQYYNGKPTLAEASVLHLGSTALTGVDAEMVLGGRIEGTVTAADTGAPIEFAEACAWTSAGQLVTCDTTDAAGHYALRSLPSDHYRIEFRAEFSWEEFVPEFYADKASFAEATDVPVTAPGTVGGVNAALTRVSSPAAPPSTGPLQSTPPPPLEVDLTPPVAKPHRLHCRKGFRKRKVKGKVRCVKIHKKHHRSSAPR